MNKTLIEWIVNPDGSRPGWSWNPLTGCLNQVNGMCKGGNFPCYAYGLANGRLKKLYLSQGVEAQVLPTGLQSKVKALADPFYPRFWPERLEMYGAPVKPCGIFVCDMGELFGDWIPRQWQERVFEVIRGSTGDRFYLLTKQPQNLIKFSPFPENCWVGLTVTHEGYGEHNSGCDGAITAMEDIEAKVKYISFEPLLSSIHPSFVDFVDWVIIGAQTKPYKPPKIEWVEEIVKAADKAGIPVFLKNNLRPLLKGLPEPFQTRVFQTDTTAYFIPRQEMPNLREG